MAAGSIAKESNLAQYRDLARTATYQAEVVLDSLLDAAHRQDDRLDLLATSLAVRLKDLNSVVMSILGNQGSLEMAAIVDGRRLEVAE